MHAACQNLGRSFPREPVDFSVRIVNRRDREPAEFPQTRQPSLTATKAPP